MQSLITLLTSFIILQLYSRPVFSTRDAHRIYTELNGHDLTQIQNNIEGYECGNIYFTENEVKAVVIRCIDRISKYPNLARKYHGQLYSKRDTTKYFMWPISKKKKVYRDKNTVGSFNVVFTKENEIIDVIARISNNHFTKCIRIDSSQTGLISIPDTTNGYQCSHEFFKDEMLQEALQLALKGIEENLAPYPKPYIGNIFPQESNYKIWPIKNGNDLYKYGKIRSGPFYLVFDTSGNIKGALVKGLHDNYLRCIRKRVAPTAPASDPLSKLFVPAPKPGYMCGRTFFEDENLKEAAEIALRISTQNLKKSIYAKSQFPTKHNGKPFNRPYLLWPIVRFGALYQKGNPGPYRVALELDHKVIGAVMVENNIVKQCEKMTLKGNINHDTSDYLCLKQIFYNDHLVRTTEEACRSMKKYLNAYFPAAYRGPGYESEGPYFTYPIKKKGFFRIQPGPHRIVINSNCEFVGALTTIKTGFGSKLVKCHRLETDPEITEMPIVTNEHISEQRILT